MPRTSGQVTNVQQRQTKTGKTFYIVTANGKDYSLWESPNFSVGMVIEYDELQKGQYLNMGSPKVVEFVPAAPGPNKPTAGGKIPFGDPEREARIVRQNASSTAAALIGASKVAGKQDVETLLAVLRETSKRIFEMNMHGYDVGASVPSIPSEAKVKADAEELFG